MDKTQIAHKQEQKVIKEFHRGMDYYAQGYMCPVDDSPLKSGWLAAQEMDKVKKYWLGKAKNEFIDV